MDKKTRFLNIYYNVPVKLRTEAILVLGSDPQKKIITWNVAYQEITQDTELSQQILDKLEKLNII